MIFFTTRKILYDYSHYRNGYQGLKEITIFLGFEEVYDIRQETSEDDFAVKIESGNFYWRDEVKEEYTKKEIKRYLGDVVNEEVINLREKEVILRNINLEIKKGELVAIIGNVGSGKSSLLSAILSEMNYSLNSNIKLNGRVSYTSQTPFLTNFTIKENIIFGEKFNKKKYERILEISGLSQDLKSIENGNELIIKEDTANLSGGQKMRISLARAFYKDSDIYIFDDPISALDKHVRSLVFKKAILEELKGKTRVVAMNLIENLGYFDKIILIDKGQIRFKGSYSDTI